MSTQTTHLSLCYHAAAALLNHLPGELVHIIFDDLTLTKILERLCNHPTARPHLSNCVLSHLHLSKIFTSRADLDRALGWFSVYLKLCAACRLHPHPKLKDLDIDAAAVLAAGKQIHGGSLNGVTWDEDEKQGIRRIDRVVEVVKAGVREGMDKYIPFLSVLRHYALSPDLPSSKALSESGPGNATHNHADTIPDSSYWDYTSHGDIDIILQRLDSAERNMNSKKKEQLGRWAGFLERYPMLLQIYTGGERDPGGEQDRLQYARHCSQSLRRDERTMPERSILDNKWVGRSVFACTVPLVMPSDRILRLFLKTLRRFPPRSEPDVQDVGVPESGVGAANSRARKSKKNNHQKCKNATPHTYPELLKLPFVLENLAHPFPRHPEQAQPPRVLYTEYSCKTHSHNDTDDEDDGTRRERARKKLFRQPRMYVPAHRPKVVSMKKEERGKWVWDDREFEWLDAFVGVCEYMSAMEEAWGNGVSVREYWATHA